VPAGPINDIAAAFAFADELGLQPWDDAGGVRTVRSPVRLGDTPAGVRRRPPRLGEHDAEIRAWLADDGESGLGRRSNELWADGP
jgi:crotonobetainyl-CoA:carnitine CoA-transferase CaiB-like acyl-CoA transferase